MSRPASKAMCEGLHVNGYWDGRATSVSVEIKIESSRKAGKSTDSTVTLLGSKSAAVQLNSYVT